MNASRVTPTYRTKCLRIIVLQSNFRDAAQTELIVDIPSCFDPNQVPYGATNVEINPPGTTVIHFYICISVVQPDISICAGLSCGKIESACFHLMDFCTAAAPRDWQNRCKVFDIGTEQCSTNIPIP